MESNAKAQPVISEQGTSITWADLSKNPSFVIGEDVGELFICLNSRTRMHLHAYTRTSEHAWMRVCAVCACVRTHARTHAHMHARTHIHTQTHACMEHTHSLD